MSQTPKLNVVVAACNGMGIGVEGRIPWRLKGDMAFFKKITSETENTDKKNIVVMGKKTWLSIPPKFRPLPGRLNVILSTQMTEAPAGTFLVRTFDEAVKLGNSQELKDQVESVFIIGGASLYREAMMGIYSCRLYFTRVNASFTCDTFFPAIDENIFQQISNPQNVPEGDHEENGIKFSFEVYEKK